MLKRGFYDLFTGISFVLVIALSILTSGISSSNILQGELEGVANALLFFQLTIGAIIFIYWGFMLFLAINLYQNSMVIVLEVLLTVVLIPFTPIIYILLLRSPLKEYSEHGPNKIKKSMVGNVPGTP